MKIALVILAVGVALIVWGILSTPDPMGDD